MRPRPQDYPSAAAFQGACIKFNRENYRNPMKLISVTEGSRKWWGFEVENFGQVSFGYGRKKDAQEAYEQWLANFDKMFVTDR